MNPVLEFKFACPVCHQHIKCEAAASGQILSCPTCFRNIIVPQPPSGQTTRLILRAKQASTRKQTAAPAALRQSAAARKTFAVAAAAAVVVAAVVFVANQVKQFKLAHRPPVTMDSIEQNQI